jgi:hypothetical protein
MKKTLNGVVKDKELQKIGFPDALFDKIARKDDYARKHKKEDPGKKKKAAFKKKYPSA